MDDSRVHMDLNRIWEEIQQGYRFYEDEMATGSHISIHGEAERPQQKIIRENLNISIGELETEASRKYLISFRDDLPNVPELPMEILEQLGVELIGLLDFPISRDHNSYWEWTYFVSDRLTNSEELMPHEIWSDLSKLFNLALCDWVGSPHSHEFKVTTSAHTIAAYLAYPLLEGLTKRLCADDISKDGTVKRDNRVEKFSGEQEFYVKSERCYRIHEILWHFEEKVANSVLQAQMRLARTNIRKFGDRPEGQEYGIIFDWRNQLVHGQRAAGVQFGVVLNLICIILWDLIRTDTRIR